MLEPPQDQESDGCEVPDLCTPELRAYSSEAESKGRIRLNQLRNLQRQAGGFRVGPVSHVSRHDLFGGRSVLPQRPQQTLSQGVRTFVLDRASMGSFKPVLTRFGESTHTHLTWVPTQDSWFRSYCAWLGWAWALTQCQVLLPSSLGLTTAISTNTRRKGTVHKALVWLPTNPAWIPFVQ